MDRMRYMTVAARHYAFGTPPAFWACAGFHLAGVDAQGRERDQRREGAEQRQDEGAAHLCGLLHLALAATDGRCGAQLRLGD